MEHAGIDENLMYIGDFREKFDPSVNVNAVYKFMIKERKKPLIVQISNSDLNCYYGNHEDPEVLCKLNDDVMNRIVSGQMTFQRAFMSGDMQVKGDFRRLRMLDQAFTFVKED